MQKKHSSVSHVTGYLQLLHLGALPVTTAQHRGLEVRAVPCHLYAFLQTCLLFWLVKLDPHC